VLLLPPLLLLAPPALAGEALLLLLLVLKGLVGALTALLPAEAGSRAESFLTSLFAGVTGLAPATYPAAAEGCKAPVEPPGDCAAFE
jgi:hypothetical protein